MSFYDFTVKTRRGEDFDLSTLRGKAVLVVNTATGCGFTPQYKGLEALYERYHERGLVILDFPCNQFNNQAPGSDEEIHQFCTLRYKTQFDQMKKIEVNGENESPLYTFLKAEAPEEEVSGIKNKAAMKMISSISKTAKNPGDIRWNFTKFLVGRDGKVVKRYAPVYGADVIEADLLSLL